MEGVLTFLVDIATTLGAVAGFIVVIVGLWMCWTAFEDARKAAPKSVPSDGTTPSKVIVGGLLIETTGRGSREQAEAGNITIPIGDVVKVLPELIKTAAGIAVAVLLLGVVLLIGSAFVGSGDDAGASPAASPAAGSSPGPTGSPR